MVCMFFRNTKHLFEVTGLPKSLLENTKVACRGKEIMGRKRMKVWFGCTKAREVAPALSSLCGIHYSLACSIHHNTSSRGLQIE